MCELLGGNGAEEPGKEFATGAYAGLAVEARDVLMDGGAGEAEAGSDLFFAGAGEELFENMLFAGGEMGFVRHVATFEKGVLIRGRRGARPVTS